MGLCLAQDMLVGVVVGVVAFQLYGAATGLVGTQADAKKAQ